MYKEQGALLLLSWRLLRRYVFNIVWVLLMQALGRKPKGQQDDKA